MRVSVPPLGPRLQLVRSSLVLLAIVSIAVLLQLLVVSRLQAHAAQGQAFDDFRGRLARGVAPIGPTDEQGRPLALGTPVAFLEIPSIGLRQVIGEGTTPSVLFGGPGHRRDTPLPGQIGTSVVLGRRAAYGGAFANLTDLAPGDRITLTTGQGVFQYSVLGVRPEGVAAPAAPEPTAARLLLVTAAGSPFLPEGLLRVDADLVGEAVVGPTRLVGASGLTAAERAMGSDTSTLWALALWLQALIVLSLGVVWAWHRWGRAQAWVVFLPPLLLVGLAASGEAARLLPNLM